MNEPHFPSSSPVPTRLYCIPHAGSGPSSFRAWRSVLAPRIEVVPLSLPGREARFSEPMLPSFDALVRDLADAVKGSLDLPYALLGHSMGALLAFELARWFRREKLPEPLHIFVSAHRAPHLPEQRPLHSLPDSLLRAELNQLRGTPSEVLQDGELLRVLLPVLRADLRICETYACRPEPPLACAITCLGGANDTRVSKVQLVAWKRHTTGPFRMRLFPGGHFYLYDDPTLVGEAVLAELEGGGNGVAAGARKGGAAHAG
jgi:surfactin synthase thioesterase subunit